MMDAALKSSPTSQPDSQMDVVFLKLGGSLITDKTTPRTPRHTVMARLAAEIAAALSENPGVRLVLGNGAGSFGHVPAKKYGTRQGVHTPEQWHGFAEVWREAAALNRLVTDALHEAGLPAISLHPSAGVTAQNGKVAAWDISPIQAALHAGLLPVVHGDVIFDTVLGGTILSTEDLFEYLARKLRPARILLAGIEAGVWADYPACTHLVSDITALNYAAIAPTLSGSHGTDVTGGMLSKVEQSLALAQEIPGLQILIFSGETPGNVARAISGHVIGTLIR